MTSTLLPSRFFSFVLIGLLLGGCNNSSTPTDERPIKEGVFIDSPVANARYISEDLSGFTDSNGKFRYREGAKVKFYVGEILLGEAYPIDKQEGISASANKIITPLELAHATNIQDEKVIQISRFLIGLDKDGNPDNGIDLDLSHPSLNTPKETNILDLELESSFTNIDFPPSQEVIEHLTTTLVPQENPTPPLDTTSLEGNLTEESNQTSTNIPEENLSNQTSSEPESELNQTNNSVEITSTTQQSTTTPPPIITLNGDPDIQIILGNGYIEYDANATDAEGNPLEVTIDDSNLSINHLGEYVVSYRATDEAGNSSEVNRTVEVISPAVLVEAFNPTGLACNSFKRLSLPSYTLNNNDWGRSYLDANASGVQCVFGFEENGTTKGGWYWGWPYNNDYQVKGYPEAIYGAKFQTIYDAQSGFPAQVDTINSVTVDLSYRDINITNSYNIALEFWLHDSVDTSMDNIKYEIMLRFDPAGFHPSNVWKSVTLDGITFDVYKDGEYGDDRVFINFVAQQKVTDMQLDLKPYIDFLVDNGFEDMPQRYMSGVEMGVEVIYGSGVLILDKMDVNLEFNANEIANSKLEQSFVAWCSDLDADMDLEKGTDLNNSGLKWRASTTSLDLRKKNGTLVQLVRSTANSYLFTMFDTPFDMSQEDAAVKFTGVLGSDYLYKLMLYDGSNWCQSDKSFDSNSFSLRSVDVWEHIAQSADMTEAFNTDGSLPSLSTDGNCSAINLANIKGFGLYYTLKSDRDTGYFKMDTLALYQSLPNYGVDEKRLLQDDVSEKLFGLCTTPAYDTSTNENLIGHYKEWTSYLRWPGGSLIESYDLENSGDTTTYSVGKWTAYMKEQIPSLDFLLGVSSSKGWLDEENVTAYGSGLVNYLNVDYNTSWGDNPALEKALPLHYVEIGNEPELVSGFSADGYGKALSDYATGIHQSDPSVKILAPTTIHDSLNWLFPTIIKDYGDNIDIVSIHDYTDDPSEYQSDITIARNYMQKYMSDNERRKKEEIELAFTEFNSLDHLNRGGVFHEESWAKIIWHAQTFSYFIQEGLYMSSLWHAYINGGHALYSRDGDPYPLHYALTFWRDQIDFDQNPRVALSNSTDRNILITAVKMDDKLRLFVINNSPDEDKNLTIDFKGHQFGDRVTIKTLTHSLIPDAWYDEKEVASNVDIDRLKYFNPDAQFRSETDEDNVTTYYVKFPQISVDTQPSEGVIVNEQLTHLFPKYTLTVLETTKEEDN